jgi:putative membrane protein
MTGMSERRPRWVYANGEDPDPRYSLANERTFLAWVRTALALIAGAVALHSLEFPTDRVLRAGVVFALLALGAVTVSVSALRWARIERAMRTGDPLPSLLSGLVATGGLVVLAGVLAVVVLVVGA